MLTCMGGMSTIRSYLIKLSKWRGGVGGGRKSSQFCPRHLVYGFTLMKILKFNCLYVTYNFDLLNRCYVYFFSSKKRQLERIEEIFYLFFRRIVVFHICWLS